VFNGDSAALAQGLLGEAARGAVPGVAPSQRSLSAVTWHLRARTRGFPLLRHTVFFGADSAHEFDDLFTRRRMPDDPTVYVCAQDRDLRDEAASRSLDAPERLMCLVNAPADADTRAPTDEEMTRCEATMYRKLERCGLVIEAPTGRPQVTTPADFAARYPGTGGGLYGRASHGWMASFARPGSRSRLDGLYLAGGSVHPGPGLPMAALSGRLAATSLIADLRRTATPASTSRSRRAATSGGTSTR